MIKVRVIHQIDLGGATTGGIDSVIKGIAQFAPDDVEISVVGLTSDPQLRPVGRWTHVRLGQKDVPFFPVGVTRTGMVRSKIPLSIKVLIGTFRYWKAVSQGADRFDFHRIEPAIRFFFDRRPKNLVVHQSMDVLYDRKSDIGWRFAPGLFFFIESLLIKGMSAVFCVRQSAVLTYQRKFPALASRFRFLSTWMDPNTFFSSDVAVRDELKLALCKEFGLPAESHVVVSVGRLDHQKDPLLALDAVAALLEVRRDVVLIWVGDGVLRVDVEARIRERGLAQNVMLAGLRPPAQIARILQASDVYLMSSAYEGMPISVLEAIATGLPVVSTSVGELKLIVKEGENGFLVEHGDAQALAEAVQRVLCTPDDSMRQASKKFAKNFEPHKALGLVFESYR
ncbi:glycosyltransferase [Methyloversatilis sp.]|uniref:glycosyltransferase n=1 Tax=Methyloversatilis sp. TaxID=2569862 RepID=UPI002736268A|nr:glycosyltransferase [Methyloversatilis sp.]MDP3455948.1 glycosyltransferase [Methyloversatilis sp.]